ncbi:small integral membrane protein 8 [Eurytemora carolleeae]|uniref:small integral membrane protein 8 n=1 Tax=Eurytemora carolleeae TaxID=1294199 RepID=UPI000C783993|nr:small integral membrane protein 8 [Eurytemora carolleeae]|eukprot:XP_023332638.1 small integral membrane protein 8-like [Eurytemora affinis]
MKDSKPAENPKVVGEGIRSVQTSNVFRTLNFELYAKPNKFIMVCGVLAITGCFGYLAWMKSVYKDRNLYTALDENEQLVLREKKTRWD